MSSIINKDQIVDESKCSETERQEENNDEDEELQKLLLPDVQNLPLTPPSAVESNFVTYFALDFMKPGHDQYVHRHANGLCVIGLAPSHTAFKDEGGITAVDFNVGKSDRSEMKVTGKRKKNAKHVESNTALCKISTKNDSYIVRCCVKGPLLEVNQQLIKQPELLNVSVLEIDDYCRPKLTAQVVFMTCATIAEADREGYIAIIMPKPADWLKVKASLVSLEEYKKLREVS
ncbi:Single hybrid motif [Sesbania bispinosa]|nr:Single hybrid motif [Sesbania bispinosa]